MQTIQISLHILALLIVLALLFDFMNGFHDAANAIATVVSTGVLRPQTAVAMAAFFNLAAVFVFHQLHVAASVGKGTIDPAIVDQYVIFGALIGAIFWNLVTWYYGIPSSSSHALIGGLVGSAVAKAGTGALISAGLLKTILFIVLSPLLGPSVRFADDARRIVDILSLHAPQDRRLVPSPAIAVGFHV
ncbi:phosphate/sulfate permease [Herbaspirillum rubrisubalbicans]|nr:phosphate/sulfate permease [Herbaspirillum rubrisubalbicans]